MVLKSPTSLRQSVDGHTEPIETAEVFARQCKDMYTSVPKQNSEINWITDNIECEIIENNTQSCIAVFTVEEMCTVIHLFLQIRKTQFYEFAQLAFQLIQ